MLADVEEELRIPLVLHFLLGRTQSEIARELQVNQSTVARRLAEGLERLRQRLHRMKTGALLTASCRLGALCAGSDEARLSHLTTFGAQLGMAFQIVDDVLDETSTAEVMGKAVKKDAAKGKNTYPVLLGLEGSRAAAAQALSVAMDAIASLGAPAESLRAIARFVVQRSH